VKPVKPVTTLFAAFCLFAVAQVFPKNSWSFTKIAKPNDKADLPAVLKADHVDGDQVTKVITATGNVEVTKGTSVVYADQISYDQNGKTIKAIGNVKIKNLEVGNLKASNAEIQDNFSSGKFFDSRIFFNDGSYLFSPQIDRKSPEVTVLQKPIFSICPNPEIAANNELAGQKRDMFLIKSSEMTIDRNEEKIKAKGGIFKFYDVPFFYTPYLSVALQSKKRESGFLSPSYARSTNLGFGIKTPYYFNLAPNMELMTTPFIGISNNQYVVNNELHHLAGYGEYKAAFEVANNNIINNSNTTVINRTGKKYRWNFYGKGSFDFTKNIGADFVTNLVGDRNYLRDYHTNYLNYTLSKGNLDYINGRSYHAIKVIKIQELEDPTRQSSAPFILPTIDSHIETKPFFFKEKFSLTSNVTSINRQDGLQYRRMSVVPQADLPFNLHGNLFNLGGKVQGDLYSLDNNLKGTNNNPSTFNSATLNLSNPQPINNNFESTQTNYKPEISFSWRLPLIKKEETNTLLVEPMMNFVSSSYKKSFNKLPNEDSNNSELSISNLFVNDRIAGFDRNESGQRASYGVKTSLFNRYGEFGLNVGQSYRKSNNTQDVTIRGFDNNNKSSVVGQAIYKAKKLFSVIYSFQLNQSNYSNEVNQITTNLNFGRVIFSSDYLLIRRSLQNPSKREQVSFSSTAKVSDKWKVTVGMNHDIVVGRTLSRGITLLRDGCCTVFGISVIETNPSALTKPQLTYTFTLSFKNL
jgi:LPS-assembly protein